MTIGNNFDFNTLAWLGHGSILVSALDANDRPVGGWTNVGTCKSATLALTIESKEIKETQSGTNSVIKKLTTAQNGEVTINTISFKPQNLAMVLYGDLAQDAEQPIAVYTDTAYLGKIVLVPGLIKTLTSVTDESGDISYEEGLNFVVSDSGIEILEDQSGAEAEIVDATVVKITYAKAATQRIEGFTKNAVEVAIAFTGINVANDNAASKVTYHKVSLSPAAQRALISPESEGEMEIKGSLLAAKYITGQGKSKLFCEEHAA